MIVLIFSLVMVTGVLVFIVPIFEKMFKQLGGKLPLPTQVIVTLSHEMFWIVPLAAAAGAVATVAFKRKLHDDYAWRLAFDRFKLRMPVFGNAVHQDRHQPLLAQPRHAAWRRRPGDAGARRRRRDHRQRRDQ